MKSNSSPEHAAERAARMEVNVVWRNSILTESPRALIAHDRLMHSRTSGPVIHPARR